MQAAGWGVSIAVQGVVDDYRIAPSRFLLVALRRKSHKQYRLLGSLNGVNFPTKRTVFASLPKSRRVGPSIHAEALREAKSPTRIYAGPSDKGIRKLQALAESFER